jgi:hypothetical protein
MEKQLRQKLGASEVETILLSTAGDMFGIGSNDYSVPFTTKFHCASILLQKRVCQDGYWQHITTVIQVINMLTPYGLILYFIF